MSDQCMYTPLRIMSSVRLGRVMAEKESWKSGSSRVDQKLSHQILYRLSTPCVRQTRPPIVYYLPTFPDEKPKSVRCCPFSSSAICVRSSSQLRTRSQGFTRTEVRKKRLGLKIFETRRTIRHSRALLAVVLGRVSILTVVVGYLLI